MAVSTKYGKVNIPHIGEDEPVFILRAQDRLAERSIQDYKSLAESQGAKVADTLDEEIQAFKDWDGKKKLPD